MAEVKGGEGEKKVKNWGWKIIGGGKKNPSVLIGSTQMRVNNFPLICVIFLL